MKNKIKKVWKKFREKEGYFCKRSSLISMVSLAYIIKKDFVLIVSEAIKNNILTPYYCTKYEEKEEEDIFLCKKQTFYTGLAHYSLFLGNYYFSLEDIINLEKNYHIITNNFFTKMIPTEENITTEKNIEKILRKTIRKSSIPLLSSTPTEDKFGESLFYLFLGIILLLCWFVCLIIRTLREKKEYLIEESDFNNLRFLFEDVAKTNKNLINGDDFPMLSFLISKDPKILEDYVNTHEELSKEEQSEMAFYFSFCYKNAEFGNIIKTPMQTKDAPKQAGSKLFGSFVNQIQKRKYESPNEIFPLLVKEVVKLTKK